MEGLLILYLIYKWKSLGIVFFFIFNLFSFFCGKIFFEKELLGVLKFFFLRYLFLKVCFEMFLDIGFY